MIKSIRKRDGRIVKFDPEKIAAAIAKAFIAVARRRTGRPPSLARKVVEEAELRFSDLIAGVEDIQDIVERVLIDSGYNDVAKAYILYRQKRSEIREAKSYLGVADDLKLSVNAVEVLKKRYLRRDERGLVAETPGEMFARVAAHVSQAEIKYGGDAEICRRKFLKMMRSLEFLPNSPTLMNAGLPLGQLSACFVLPVEDSLPGIFEALKNMALIHQSGGGTGFSFSRLRPKNDVVRATGRRCFTDRYPSWAYSMRPPMLSSREAGAGARTWAPFESITPISWSSSKPRRSRDFWRTSTSLWRQRTSSCRRRRTGGEIDLINPRTGIAQGQINAQETMSLIANSAWRGGDPGMIFIDRINAAHPLPGIIETTNPCGEQPLLPYESCNLGSINLAKMVEKGELNWERLAELVSLAVRFLDDVIDVNRFPLKQIEEATLQSRKIGLGVMGFAEMLILMNISYNSQEAVRMAEEVMKFISEEAREASAQLGKERGSFPLFEQSQLKKLERHEKRHCDHDRAHGHHQHHRGDEQRHRAALRPRLCAPRAGGRAPFGGLAPLRAKRQRRAAFTPRS